MNFMGSIISLNQMVVSNILFLLIRVLALVFV